VSGSKKTTSVKRRLSIQNDASGASGLTQLSCRSLEERRYS